jgi:hypothetical protein
LSERGNSDAWDLLRAKARKFNEPSAVDLGLPDDLHALWALEATLEAPRAAWRAYHAAIGYFADEDTRKNRRRRR